MLRWQSELRSTLAVLRREASEDSRAVVARGRKNACGSLLGLSGMASGKDHPDCCIGLSYQATRDTTGFRGHPCTNWVGGHLTPDHTRPRSSWGLFLSVLPSESWSHLGPLRGTKNRDGDVTWNLKAGGSGLHP